MGDCLLECLKEARLDRYYPNFVQRGLKTCESLINLPMQDYTRYGVVSMEDRLHLFKLIQIIKSVQAEGVVCKHSGHVSTGTGPVQQPIPSHQPLPRKDEVIRGLVSYTTSGNSLGFTSSQTGGSNIFSGLTLKPPDMTNQVVPLNPAMREVKVTQQAPILGGMFQNQGPVIRTQPSHIGQAPVQNKPAAIKLQGRPLFREKPLFEFNKVAKKSPEVVFRAGSDSPVFKCRKTLQFTDSDVEGDEDDGFLSKPSKPESSAGLAHQSSKGRAETPSDHTEQPPSNPAHVTSTYATQGHELPNLASPKTSDSQGSQPRAFFVDVERQSATKHNGSRDSSNRSSMSSLSTHVYHHGNPHSQVPIIQSREPSVEHAYFPVESGTPQEPQTVHVEKVIHGNGYNYGVPNSPNAAVNNNNPQGSSSGPVLSDKIRVCVRKRPLTVKEVKRRDFDIVKAFDSKSVAVDEPKLSVDLNKYIQQHVFTFDEVFDNTVSNEEMYKKAVKPLVKCVLNRGTATCFAFGQTGAGKTYTLLGSKATPGMYKLAAHDILNHIHQPHKAQTAGMGRAQKQALWISYYEIYCGQLFDLLNKRKKLQVRENGKQKVCLAGLTETQAKDLKSLVQAIQYGNLARSTGSTGANAHSSRSHAVLQLELRDHKDVKIGRLSFIDLAGSERASDVTDYDRQTRTEGAEINQSLLALKECIRSIDQDSSHTPYRQSKLTHILRDSFLGNSKTVMIANIAPAHSSCENTLNTLRYADRVKELRKSNGNKSQRNTPGSKSSPPASVANGKTPLNKRAASLFHPSKIQYSSTPKHSGSPADNPVEGDLSRVLREAYESPIRGHRFPAGSVIKCHPTGKPTVELGHQDINGVTDKVVDGVEKADIGSQSQGDVNNNKYDVEDSGRRSAGDVDMDAQLKRPISAITLERVVANVSHIMGSAAISNKELDPKVISSPPQNILASLLQRQQDVQQDGLVDQPAHRLNTGSSCENTPPGATVKSQSLAQSTHSTQSEGNIIKEHRNILSHLDHVLGKAKSVIMNTTPTKETGHSGGLQDRANRSGDSGISQKSTVISPGSSSGHERHRLYPSVDHLTQPETQSRMQTGPIGQPCKPRPELSQAEKEMLDKIIAQRKEAAKDQADPAEDRRLLPWSHVLSSSQQIVIEHRHADTPSQGPVVDSSKSTGAIKDMTKRFQHTGLPSQLTVHPKKLFDGSCGSHDSDSEKLSGVRYLEGGPPEPNNNSNRDISDRVVVNGANHSHLSSSGSPMHRSELDSLDCKGSTGKGFNDVSEHVLLLSGSGSAQHQTQRPGTPSISTETASYGSKGSKNSRESSLDLYHDSLNDHHSGTSRSGLNQELATGDRIIPSGRLSNPLPCLPVSIDTRRAITPDDSFRVDLGTCGLKHQVRAEVPSHTANFHGLMSSTNQANTNYYNTHDSELSSRVEVQGAMSSSHGYNFMKNELIPSGTVSLPSVLHHKTASSTGRAETHTVENNNMNDVQASLPISYAQNGHISSTSDLQEAPGRSWADLLSKSSESQTVGLQSACISDSGLSTLSMGLSYPRQSSDDTTASVGYFHQHKHSSDYTTMTESSGHGTGHEMDDLSRVAQIHHHSAFTQVDRPITQNCTRSVSDVLRPAPGRDHRSYPHSASEINQATVCDTQHVSQGAYPVPFVATTQTGAAFTPIQPCPITPRDRHGIAVPAAITKTSAPSSGRARGDGREMTDDDGTSPTSVDHLAQSDTAEEETEELDSAKNDHQQMPIITAQNQLILAHEEQLSEIIAMCKQEMKLLLSVRGGTTTFDDYLVQVEQVMCTKAQSVASLLSQIDSLVKMADTEPQS